MESILQVVFLLFPWSNHCKSWKQRDCTYWEERVWFGKSFIIFFVSVSKIDKFIDKFCTAMPNLTWNMNLNSSAALCILSTCKILEVLTIIGILIKYILRNLFYSAPVFKKCLFFLQKFSHKYRRSESVDLHYLNSDRGLTNLQCNTPECFTVSFPGGTILFPNVPRVWWECR